MKSNSRRDRILSHKKREEQGLIGTNRGAITAWVGIGRSRVYRDTGGGVGVEGKLLGGGSGRVEWEELGQLLQFLWWIRIIAHNLGFLCNMWEWWQAERGKEEGKERDSVILLLCISSPANTLYCVTFHPLSLRPSVERQAHFFNGKILGSDQLLGLLADGCVS